MQIGEHSLNGMAGSEDNGGDFAGGIRQGQAVESGQPVESGRGGGVKEADVDLVQVIGEKEALWFLPGQSNIIKTISYDQDCRTFA